MRPIVVSEITPDAAPGAFRDFIALYRSTFLDPQECEDPSSWPARMADPPPPGQPRTRLLGAFSGSALAGGLVYEAYPESRCGLLTYLAVAPQFRRAGIGSLLVMGALEHFRQLPDGGARAVFSEVEDPALVAAGENEGPDPQARLAFFDRLKARRVAIGYVQPDLGDGAGRARHLLLLCYASSLPGGALPREILVDFLREFYGALGVDVSESDPDFRAMTNSLPDPVPLEPLLAPAT